MNRKRTGVRPTVWLLLLALAPGFPLTGGRPPDAETRVVDYLRAHIAPGQPLPVTELYNRVFTRPDERQALNKLYNAFFRIPLFVAEYQQKFAKPPSLAVISQQFDFHALGTADVLLRLMEADPRVPRFLSRDPKTGEIIHVDVGAIRSDPQFGRALERQLGGWSGQVAPELKLQRLGGGTVDLLALRGKPVLLYVWFTGCPPCLQETRYLVKLASRFPALAVIGANADQVLGLGYDDGVRERYAQEHRINFPIVAWTREADAAYGGISIFPTLFLIDRRGVIRRQWIGFVSEAELQEGTQAVLGN